MDDPSRQRSDTVTSLRDAVRKARLDDAERGGAIADLRAGELVRLEILRDALAPIFAELPDDAELFDHGLVPGERPRLFVDILAFVEMGRDRRHYRFVQDSRWGQRVIIETDDIQAVLRAVTDYIALRLVERRKALAADSLPTPPPPRARAMEAEPPRETPPRETPPTSTGQAPPPRPAGSVSPVLVFALGILAGILVTLFVGLMRSRGFLTI